MVQVGGVGSHEVGREVEEGGDVALALYSSGCVPPIELQYDDGSTCL